MRVRVRAHLGRRRRHGGGAGVVHVVGLELVVLAAVDLPGAGGS